MTQARIRTTFQEHGTVLARSQAELMAEVAAFADELIDALRNGGKLLVFGNGGSAADAQHFAAELTGHFLAERDPFPAIALTTDTSALTAIANDYGYDEVYARQVRALGRPGDLAVGISTSGKAQSVVRALRAARDAEVRCWVLTGGTGGPAAQTADRALIVPSDVTARIQEMHITIIHAVCAAIDDALAAPGTGV